MTELPRGAGLWAGFLEKLPAGDAVAAVQQLEQGGVTTIWLQEYGGVDPFIRAALYLSATRHLTVALGIATIHARDPEAMVAAASTLEEAFPGRFALGIGASHRHLAESRGATYTKPLAAMRAYLGAMQDVRRGRSMPRTFLGALGPKMIELAAETTAGVHTYFCPPEHSEEVRRALPAPGWLAPTQMVAVSGDDDWRDQVRPYLGLCLGMPNYRANLHRYGFTEVDLDTTSDRLVDALIVPDRPDAVAERVRLHQDAGADHVVLQVVPPPPAADVVERVVRTGLASTPSIGYR